MQNKHQYLYNGQRTDPSSIPNGFDSRAFLYADGFFESMLVVNNAIPLFDLHYERISASLSAYKITPKENLASSALREHLLSLANSSGLSKCARIRLTIFRSNQGGGKYTPASNEADWVAHIERNEHVGFKLNEKGIAISIFEDLKKNPSKFSMFKNIHSQIYIQAAIYAKEKNIGDVLVLNSDDNIIEATSSNVFLVSGGELYTPKLSSGPVGGVMRATIINLAISMGIKVFECNLTPQELLKADEVFLTNAVQGIKWVSSYRTKRYFNKTANKLLDAFNASIGEHSVL